ILSRIGEQNASIKVYGDVLADYPRQPKVSMSYGHALKTAGRQKESIDAYRKSIELAPNLGEAYWSLANLKKSPFTDDDIPAMPAQLQGADLQPEDRVHFDFAVGKDLEDEGAYEDSFRHFERGNAIRLDAVGYEADDTTEHMRRSKAALTR